MFIIGSLCTNINVHKKVYNKGQKTQNPVFGLHHLQVFYVELFCFVLFRFYELFVCGRWNKVSSRPSVCHFKKKKKISHFFSDSYGQIKEDTLWRTSKYAVISFSLSRIIFIIYPAIFLKYIFFFRVVNTLVFSSTL